MKGSNNKHRRFTIGVRITKLGKEIFSLNVQAIDQSSPAEVWTLVTTFGNRGFISITRKKEPEGSIELRDSNLKLLWHRPILFRAGVLSEDCFEEVIKGFGSDTLNIKVHSGLFLS